MNDIQKRIDVELRRPNAGKNALCNVIASILDDMASQSGDGSDAEVVGNTLIL